MLGLKNFSKVSGCAQRGSHLALSVSSMSRAFRKHLAGCLHVVSILVDTHASHLQSLRDVCRRVRILQTRRCCSQHSRRPRAYILRTPRPQRKAASALDSESAARRFADSRFNSIQKRHDPDRIDIAISTPPRRTMATTYHGNCHCGAFKFTFTPTEELKSAIACDCSICSRNSYRSTVAGSGFVVTKGDIDSTLATYLFGKREWAHKFCKVCGTSVLIQKTDESGLVLVNLRAVQDIDLDSLALNTDFKGSTIEPFYKAPTSPDVECPPGSSRYSGSCHCGTVTYTLVQEAKLTTVSDCNCSICSRNGALHAMIQTADLTLDGAETGVTEYRFGDKKLAHTFCKTCGVFLYARFPTPLIMTLNARTFNGFDLGEVAVKKSDNKARSPEYVVPE
ncbi:hypothetical protein HMN09_00878100 [Mycena chlorophos]|uniref:CENP-V/GFA domain-containing protein n=1 Tax=Mycena chlorophos TaxID=658473 RepID=A0A8H6SPM9_MYCCL|nr:hypothetical protein HMN09_00878100 [Mycena chlorophos]